MPDATTAVTPLQSVATREIDAAEEQAWNEQQLAEPVLRPGACLWRYLEPAVVLGRSQLSLLATLDERRHRFVARASGGGAVLVGPWMLGASVVLPLGHRLLGGDRVADGYRWLGELFVQALAQHGLAAMAVPRERTRKASEELAWACFAGISPWEVAVDDRKLVGFAQRRNRNGVLLVAGALLSAVPWESLCEAMQRPPVLAHELAATTIDASQLLARPLRAPVLAETVSRLLTGALG
jgi:lipoate-protein ligase A